MSLFRLSPSAFRLALILVGLTPVWGETPSVAAPIEMTLGGVGAVAAGPWTVAFLEPSGAQLLYVLGGLVGLVALYVLALNAIIATRSALGRKPTFADEVAKLADQLKGLAPKEQVEVLVGKLATFATKEELAAVTAQLHTFATKEDMSQRFSTLDSHVREGLHGIRGDLQVIKLDGENRATELHDDIVNNHDAGEKRAASIHDRINIVAERLAELVGAVRSRGKEKA